MHPCRVDFSSHEAVLAQLLVNVVDQATSNKFHDADLPVTVRAPIESSDDLQDCPQPGYAHPATGGGWIGDLRHERRDRAAADTMLEEQPGNA